jgi:hypothetical protein
MLSPFLHRLLAQARTDDLRREGDSQRRAARARADLLPVASEVAVTLRLAFPGDATSLERLAALDSAQPLSEPVMLAEVGGQLRAAISLWDRAVIADPFQRTEAHVELLRARARQLAEEAAAPGSARRQWARFGLPAWR